MVKNLVVGKVDPEALEGALGRLARGEHPKWCHLEWCNVKADGSGYHQTEPVMVLPQSESEPSVVMVSVKCSPLCEVPVVYLETHHAPEVNAYAGMPDEPELTVLSVRQARRLMVGLSEVLSHPTL